MWKRFNGAHKGCQNGSASPKSEPKATPKLLGLTVGGLFAMLNHLIGPKKPARDSPVRSAGKRSRSDSETRWAIR